MVQGMGRTLVSMGKETIVEKEFRIKRMNSIMLMLKWGLFATCIIYGIILVITLVAYIIVPELAGVQILICRIITFLILAIMFGVLDWIKIKSYYMLVMSFVLVIVAIFGMF